ncbi:MAG: aldolase/citrate lyase family protein [Ahrensia sp.]|nr:aldolase/citrate lyase family protein [Ahrensia sp.]
MAVYPLMMAERMRAGQTLYTVWSSIPENNLVDYLSTLKFEAVTLDMQHGGHDEASVYNGVAAIIRRERCAVVRVPVGRNDMVSRALDMGAEAVISPMINSVEDAIAFADAMKYPPMGKRSWGASRAVSVRGIEGGNAFLHSANAQTISFAMIETTEAYAALDEILAIEGIDAVFVGPADFSIALTGGREVNPSLETMMATIADIANRAKKAGKFAGIFAMDPKVAPQFAQMGYQFIAAGFETSLITAGADTFYDLAGILSKMSQDAP